MGQILVNKPFLRIHLGAGAGPLISLRPRSIFRSTWRIPQEQVSRKAKLKLWLVSQKSIYRHLAAGVLIIINTTKKKKVSYFIYTYVYMNI